jgi:two-component system sensor histidine kinase UhpB
VGGTRAFLAGRPILLQAALDIAGAGLVWATFAQVENPDVLLHVVWVVLALDAFAFGLRVTAVRILLASAAVVAYSTVAAADPAMLTLDLEEWPLMVLIAVVVAVMADRLSAVSRRYAGLYRQASSRLLTAQEDERHRLARDLHDGVGQTVAAIALNLDAAEGALRNGDVDVASALWSVQRAQRLAGFALDEARGVAVRLRPPRLAEAGLVAAIRELADRSATFVAVAADPSLARPGLLPLDTEVEVFRIVQEALANALRHAATDKLWIDLRTAAGRLEVEVGDNGIGFERRHRETGLGLAGMAERATAIGGELSIQSIAGSGTRVRLQVELPWPATASSQPAGAEASAIGDA